jgi:predicted helicase
VIVGNPPYSVGQTSGNDNNANLKYPTLDASIRETYAARSTATNKNSLYDSYIRAIRWASDRVLRSEQGGVICYVSNGGYIDGNTADGLRKTLASEFHHVYVFNLRGNQRTAGEQSRKEGGKVFDSGSRNTVAILLLIKLPGPVTECVLHYKDVGDYLTRAEKLAAVDSASLATLDWERLTPNPEGDWINQRDPHYDAYPPIAEKGNPHTIFAIQSGGLKTNRDAWVYNSSEAEVRRNVERMIEFYNAQLERAEGGASFARDAEKISWSGGLESLAKRGTRISFDATSERLGLYRPFQKQFVVFDSRLNERRYRLNELFPSPERGTIGLFSVAPGGSGQYALLASNLIPDLHLLETGQFFARYSYVQRDPEPTQDGLFAGLMEGDAGNGGDPERIDNITDWALGEYQRAYGPQVSKDDIFYYVYGLLHSPEYRERYAADLKKQLPRIPMVRGDDGTYSRERFEAFAAAGRALADLHIGYEAVEPYLLEISSRGCVVEEGEEPGGIQTPFDYYAVTKMKYAGKAGAWDKTRIAYNAWIDISGIPEDAQRYMLGSRSALDWVIERYQVKTDKASGIVNDPNDWSREHGEPRYILDLIGRVVAVSLETVRVVDSLPGLGV